MIVHGNVLNEVRALDLNRGPQGLRACNSPTCTSSQNAYSILRAQHMLATNIQRHKCHKKRAHSNLNQGPTDLQSAALSTELCTHLKVDAQLTHAPKFAKARVSAHV